MYWVATACLCTLPLLPATPYLVDSSPFPMVVPSHWTLPPTTCLPRSPTQEDWRIPLGLPVLPAYLLPTPIYTYHTGTSGHHSVACGSGETAAGMRCCRPNILPLPYKHYFGMVDSAACALCTAHGHSFALRSFYLYV